ncbi:hypothetical protein DV738_g4475, partial [Chaetothyriales sp. CBS 135597]
MAGSTLETISISHHSFEKPVKKIHDGPDVTFFLTSVAYRDLMTFILQLNRSLVPRRSGAGVQLWPLGSPDVQFSDSVQTLLHLLDNLSGLMKDAPPDTGPRRFGNVSFRKWFHLVEEKADQLLGEFLADGLGPAKEELSAYLLGSFGSPQRLDYGTGHELSFVAFLACLWKLGFFAGAAPGVEERGIVLGVFDRYLRLIRTLIKTYTLEPAGSHGVWGLDDNSFLPYMFGSAQLCPAISETDDTPTEGSVTNAPEPAAVAKANLVDKEKGRNLYFSAIAFIYEVKKGPFWEHSPILYDISGIKDGWGKINKGMIKMYNAEVLSKFPVVQHFPFGSLLKWEKDPEANEPAVSVHGASQPLRRPVDTPPVTRQGGSHGLPGVTGAPWAARPPPPPGFVKGVTQAPWATTRTPAPPRGPPRLQAQPRIPELDSGTARPGLKPERAEDKRIA